MQRRTEQGRERTAAEYPVTGGWGVSWDMGDSHWDSSSLARGAEI